MVLRYRLSKRIRALATWVTGVIAPRADEQQLDFHREQIKKILLVRATFRMGDSILATPAIFLFRRNFPDARIDFVGPSISKVLFQNLPIDNHYQIYQDIPKACWAYALLMKQIRGRNYDLAVEVSCSKSALGAFIVGFSGARFRAGLRGRRDRWFNVRLDRPADNNKYRNLPAFVRSMDLEAQELFPSLILSPDEKEKGKNRLRALLGDRDPVAPIVGVFVGGRKCLRKRWPEENFIELITDLQAKAVNIVVFVGPEERDVMGFFKEKLPPAVPLVVEPSARIFASLVSNCDLFIACDSGPVHLACALRVRTIAILLLQHNFDRWAPPPSLARVVCQAADSLAKGVMEACHAELDDLCGA